MSGRRYAAMVGLLQRGAAELLRQASELLRQPHARVSETALEVGFQSISQFNRAFRRILGQSPTEYRLGLAPRGGAAKLELLAS